MGDAYVWIRHEMVDLVCWVDEPFIPKSIKRYPRVITKNSEKAVIAISPQRGFLLLHDGTRSEEMSLKELVDKYNLLNIWEPDPGWVNRFVKGLKVPRKFNVPINEIQQQMIDQIRRDGRKDIVELKGFTPCDKKGNEVTDWVFEGSYYPQRRWMDEHGNIHDIPLEEEDSDEFSTRSAW